MSDIKLFRLTQGQATELQGDASDREKPLQALIENNLEPASVLLERINIQRAGQSGIKMAKVRKQSKENLC